MKESLAAVDRVDSTIDHVRSVILSTACLTLLIRSWLLQEPTKFENRGKTQGINNTRFVSSLLVPIVHMAIIQLDK